MSKSLTAKKFPKRKYGCRYPLHLYRTPDGKLHPECYHCSGTGYKWLVTSDTDNPGTRQMSATTDKCRMCDGKGYMAFEEPIIKDVGPVKKPCPTCGSLTNV